MLVILVGRPSSSDFVQDDPPLAPPPLHVARSIEDMDVDNKDLDEVYVADSNDSDSSKDDDKEEFGVKNYSIRKSAEYRVTELDRLKYHMRCQQYEAGCPWSLRVALRQNLGYWKSRRVGGVHACLALTMSQDYQQLDSSLICRVIILLIQLSPFVSIFVLGKAITSCPRTERSGW
ncbi:hypothetical protein Ahy_B04g072610 [Arachis hypogaea]|uniref:Uncharacterized protein n=1 Tax=Arachis hypogaea TaxID=3818 RepID=A0A444ZNL0_ARAHY|nr:hypothetical protein Ahy_B04g072610 [Arachis hypogaea]